MAPGMNVPDNVLIILDGSDSMGLNTGNGLTRIAAAKRAILDTLSQTPGNVNVGLRVYGYDARPQTACRASQTLVPIGPNNRMQIASRIVGVRPIGMTPISYSLIEAINQDFAYVNGKKSIILISDGEETCDADPCDVAVDMVRHNVDVKINVIGLGLSDMDAIRQLKCVAMATKGKFYNVDTAAQLNNAVGDLFHVRQDVHAQIMMPSSPGFPAYGPPQAMQPRPVQAPRASDPQAPNIPDLQAPSPPKSR